MFLKSFFILLLFASISNAQLKFSIIDRTLHWEYHSKHDIAEVTFRIYKVVNGRVTDWCPTGATYEWEQVITDEYNFKDTGIFRIQLFDWRRNLIAESRDFEVR